MAKTLTSSKLEPVLQNTVKNKNQLTEVIFDLYPEYTYIKNL